jgi:hypothetical protein
MKSISDATEVHSARRPSSRVPRYARDDMFDSILILHSKFEIEMQPFLKPPVDVAHIHAPLTPFLLNIDE